MTPSPVSPTVNALVANVSQQVARLALEDAAEGGERGAVNPGRLGFAHELVERLSGDARQSRERVARVPLLLRDLPDRPAYRHGVSIALTLPLDKRKRSTYCSGNPNRTSR